MGRPSADPPEQLSMVPSLHRCFANGRAVAYLNPPSPSLLVALSIGAPPR